MSRRLYYDEEAKQFFPEDDVYEKHEKTNGDRIRAMSVEELAAWLNRSHSHAYYAGAWRRSVGVPVDGYRIPENYAEWLEWLQQEATEDENS